MDSKRRLLLAGASCTGFAALLSRYGLGHDRVATAPQTKGPFYPVPEIEKQEFFDADLTRRASDAPVADGKIIAIDGAVLSHDEKPLSDCVVEVWQACATGRYNHPSDNNNQPLDPNFQYWARMETGDEGQFRFKTILPGKYPGRTPHIHFRIYARDRSELVTQLYFSDYEEFNRKDSIYMALNVAQRDGVTTPFEFQHIDPTDTTSEKIPTGRFTIILGDPKDSKSTPPM